MKLSVIISAYNKNDITAVHVRECMNGTYYLPDEIIVVNDGGNPDLKEKLLKLKKKTKIIYARINQDIKWNYTGARNLGLFISKGDYISIEDNDHIPDKNFYKDCVEAFTLHPKWQRLKTHKRFVVKEEDVLIKPRNKWEVIGSRPCHQDVSFNRREALIKLKGYDERFAGAYGWCSTDINRRVNRAGIVCGQAGHQYVIYSEKTRGLSSRNWRLARTQKEIQSPEGILNFTYEVETLC